ncbi:MAG: hypothetical protein K5925_03295 [Bacilli bacterium]|nr:hypothetical protein [Bacilli bacterium]
MASKGQKFKSYSSEFKEMILKEYFDGIGTPRTLSLKYDVPFKTIDNWITKTKHNIDVKVDHRPGRSGRVKEKNLTLEDYKERYEILKKYQAFLQARREKK